jgi:D-alanyl-D-alanine carboxypeptidase
MFLGRKFFVLGFVFSASLALAGETKIVEEVNAYIKPYVESNNFSGAVLVRKNGQVIFRRAFGFADREHQTRNENETSFHIASVSMQFTAIAVLRLVDAGLLSLDTTIGDYLPRTAGAQKITIRDLLTQRSGLADINDLADYADILQRHQTPTDLVARIEGRPLLFEPGSKFLHEEHSAYNLLALIVEKKTGLPFASAVRRVVLVPAGLDSSGIDDDSVRNASKVAIGYEPAG